MKRTAAVTLAVLAILGTAAAPARGTTAKPTFHEVFADTFNGQHVPLGAFSGCNHATDTPAAYCTGLTGPTRAAWWAYPDEWPDTATQRHYPVGGYYHPEDTVWIAPSTSGDGQMHIRMYRPASGGPVHSATVVPKAAMGLKYGRYVIRERASHVGTGYKSAQLLWPVSGGGCDEIDFPENSHSVPVSAFDHPANCGTQTAIDTGASWSQWHTYTIQWTPQGVDFYVDSRHVGHSSKTPDIPMDWDIQNESSLDGQHAAPGSWDQIDITYVEVDSWH